MKRTLTTALFNAFSATLSTTLLLAGTAFAQQAPTDATSGWMQGFPPPEERTIRFTDDDYFAGDKLRWTVCHFRELMPTAGVRNGTGAARPLPYALDPAIEEVSFQPTDGDAPMTWGEAFEVNRSDGLLVLHRGRVVYERYAGCLDETTLHGVMSVTKSITGLIGESLVAEGTLDESALVGELVPELADSAFGDATLRQVLDMTTALDYSEDYADPEADVWTYARAGSPLPPPSDYTGPRSYFAFLETVEKAGEHGEAFGYRTINSDALGWIIARATGQSVADWLAEHVWSRLGTEREAFYTVDSIGTPFAGGGFNATLRDLGRLGQLILDEGRLDGEEVLPAAAIARLREGGSKAAFAKAGYAALDGWSYRGMWWVSHDDHGAFAARGVHGQTIWIDPTAEMVIVRLASHPVAANAATDPTSLPAYRALAAYLMAQPETPE
ncbi:serine hydrolase [Halomonas saccharevitans]|uniref:Serine hydrolase n=1 Tax=Halomonas saccharevitans TaxID=416872 RepID=A0ABU3NI24_9GAMM|nr:serine hydrolase [Halomonas saccharevitans]MDT8880824.1 serine hydrolase [Halomonas saccharevitans]